MAVHAPPALTAATGMTAMARAVETLYSAYRHPISTGLALHAIRLLREALPRSVATPHDLDARAMCQMACTMSGMAAINAMVSVVHAIGHIVGGRYGLQHGISHSILLAPGMRRLLPVDDTPVFTLTGGIFKDAPHPNAAKLYLTWFLAKEQQSRVGSFSSRADVPPPEGFNPLTSYKIANNYREFMIDEKLIGELRRRMEGYTGPVVNKGGVR